MDNYPKLKHYNTIIVTPELVSRFESKVVRDDCMTNGCHIWTAGRHKNGYGHMKVKTKTLIASRVSYVIYKGEIPHGMQVCHRCDNPPCVNPAHLFIGTGSDNMNDCVTKGRNVNASKTHCPEGHEYAGDNLRIHKDGLRRCFTCRKNPKRKLAS